MEPERVRAYLQVACAGLGFDIGEIWWTSGNQYDSSSGNVSPESSPQLSSTASRTVNVVGRNNEQVVSFSSHRSGLRFIQLYTSKNYENRRNELINPPENENDNIHNHLRPDNHELDDSNVEKHVLSPKLVNSIYQSAQVVWANSHSPEGLIGRSDIQLQTAVGLPVAVDGSGNMCVVVMFSPNIIPSTDDAMDYLYSISRSATSCSIPCLLPVFNENSSQGRQIFALPSIHSNSHQSNKELGDGVTARFVSLDEGHSNTDEFESHELSAAPKDTFGIPMLPAFAELNNLAPVKPEDNVDIFDEASYGIWNTIMDPVQSFPDDGVYSNVNGSMDCNFDLQRDLRSGKGCLLIEGSNFAGESGDDNAFESSFQPLEQVYESSNSIRASISEARKLRLEEFCEAFLGMSVFDSADVWVAADGYPDCIQHVLSALAPNERNNVLHEFNKKSSDVLIKFWTGAVGRAYSSGNPVWSANHNVFVDPGRALAFARAKIQTVLAVPVFTGKDILPSCVVAFYSLVRSGSVPFVLRFVQQALRLLWDGLDKIKPHKSIENVWHDVQPADLGEIAADLEMQHSFLSKKRRHESQDFMKEDRRYSIESQRSTQQRAETTSCDQETNRLVASLEEISLPSGEKIFVPLQLDDNYTQMPEFHNSVAGNKVQSQIRNSQTTFLPMVHLATVTNTEGTKRAHVVVGSGVRANQSNVLRIPVQLPEPTPLPLPGRLPNTVVKRSTSTTSIQIVNPCSFFPHSPQSMSTPSSSATSPRAMQVLSPAPTGSPAVASTLDSSYQQTFSFHSGQIDASSNQSFISFEQQPLQPNIHPTHVQSQINIFTDQHPKEHFLSLQSHAQHTQSTPQSPHQAHFSGQQLIQGQIQPQAMLSSSHELTCSVHQFIEQQELQQQQQQEQQQQVQQLQQQLHQLQQQLQRQQQHNQLQQQEQQQYQQQQQQQHNQQLQQEQQQYQHQQQQQHNHQLQQQLQQNNHQLQQQHNHQLQQQQHPQLSNGQQFIQTTPMDQLNNINFKIYTEQQQVDVQQTTQPQIPQQNQLQMHEQRSPLHSQPTLLVLQDMQEDNRSTVLEQGGEHVHMVSIPTFHVGNGFQSNYSVHDQNCKNPLAVQNTSLPNVVSQTLSNSIINFDLGYCSQANYASGSEEDDDTNRSGSKCCRILGCSETAVNRRPYCARHSGNRLCEHPGCPKCAQGSTRFCIAHGGGRRCTFPGCDKGARDKFFCAAHGGGKRCAIDDCSKSAVGGSIYCTAHGGGRRCSVYGCDKSAQSSTRFCVKHGGGKKCAQDGCEKVARGRTNYCAAHGGGIRCKLEGCNRVAVGKLQLCRTHGGGSRLNKKPSNSSLGNIKHNTENGFDLSLTDNSTRDFPSAVFTIINVGPYDYTSSGSKT